MADSITLVAVDRITINLKAERERINTPRLYRKGQRVVLLSAVDAFEKGDIQGMIDIMQRPSSKALFDYPIWEFLDDVFYKIIQDFCLERKAWKKESEG